MLNFVSVFYQMKLLERLLYSIVILIFASLITPLCAQVKDTSELVFKSRSADATAPDLVYRIQVGTVRIKTKAPYLLKRYHIKDTPFLEVEDANTVKVMIGSYPNYSSAATRVAELKKSGLKGAFIIPYYKGKRVSLQEAAAHTVQ